VARWRNGRARWTCSRSPPHIRAATLGRSFTLVYLCHQVLEYAAPAWHHLINRTQAQHLESVQKRAIHIIFSFTRCMSYPNVLFVAQLESLETRRNNLSRSFFKIFANQPPVFIISFHLPQAKTHHFLVKTQFTHEKVVHS